MSVDRVLQLKLIGDVSDINKGLKSTQGRLRSLAGSAGSWFKAAGIGLAIEGVGQLTTMLGDAWDGFREGEKAAGRLGNTWTNLGLASGDLEDAIGKVGDMALRLGTDDVEAIDAFNKALLQTGGKPAQAMDRLRIAQDLVANGSAPNLKAALKIVDGAAKGSAKVIRDFGLESDTAGGRVRELSKKVKGAAQAAADLDPIRVAMNGIGEGLESVVGALSQGDLEGALGGLRDIGSAISKAWSDVFPAIDKAMSKLVGTETWEDAKGLAQGLLDKTSEIMDRLGTIWGQLQPHIQNAVDLCKPLIDGLATTVGLFADNVKLALDGIIALLNGDFTGAWNAIEGIVGNARTAVEGLVNGFVTFLQGIAPSFLAAAKGIADAIAKPIQDGIGAIRDAWNSLDFAIPAWDFSWSGVSVPTPSEIPGIVKDALGIGDTFQILPGGSAHVWDGTGDLIPDMAKGGIVRKRPGGMLARIGEGSHDEAVIPLDGRGIGGNVYNITVNGAVGDRMAIAREVVELIKDYERRAGPQFG